MESKSEQVVPTLRAGTFKLMIPFCRTIEEGPRVQAEMEKLGLKRGANGLEIYVMCEIPSNVILAAEFAEIFDGFSIGSNDLTQLILGVDHDSEIVAPIFNERNAAVKTIIAQEGHHLPEGRQCRGLWVLSHRQTESHRLHRRKRRRDDHGEIKYPDR